MHPDYTEFCGKLKERILKEFPNATFSDRLLGNSFQDLVLPLTPNEPDLVVHIHEYSARLSFNSLRKAASVMSDDDIIGHLMDGIRRGYILHCEFSFGEAVSKLRDGWMVTRKAWNGTRFIFAQVPSEIAAKTIPMMTSLPPKVKEELISRNLSLRYSNQLASVSADNSITGWTPSTEDAFSNDWMIYSH